MPPQFQFWLVVKKELKLLLASPGRAISAMVFTAVVAVVYQHSLEQKIFRQNMAIYGLMLCTLVFLSAIVPAWQAQAEKEKQALRSIVISPLDLSILFLAKTAAGWLLLLLVCIFMFPVYFILLRGSLDSRALPLIFVILAGLAMSASGIIVTAIAGETKIKNILLPLLQLPLMVPVVILALNSIHQSSEGTVGNAILLACVSPALYLAGGSIFYAYALMEVHD